MKYVTFSYDDNCYLNKKLLSILNDYNAKCTLNLNSGMIKVGKIANHFLGAKKYATLDEIKEMIKETNHEIASHGEKHLDLTKLSNDVMTKNILNDKKNLEIKFDRKIVGFAYPYGSNSIEIKKALTATGICYARTTISTYSFDIPKDFLTWNPTCHHNDKELLSLAKDFVKLNTEEDKIFYIWGHAFEYGILNNWNRLTELLDILKEDQSICYVTNKEIYDKCKNN